MRPQVVGGGHAGISAALQAHRPRPSAPSGMWPTGPVHAV